MAQFPVEEPPRVFGMVLRIAAGRHVEDDAALAFLFLSLLCELQTELSFSDARGADDNSKRSRDQPAAEHDVEFGDPRLKSWALWRGH